MFARCNLGRYKAEDGIEIVAQLSRNQGFFEKEEPLSYGRLYVQITTFKYIKTDKSVFENYIGMALAE